VSHTSFSAKLRDLSFDQDLTYDMVREFRLFAAVHLDAGMKQATLVAKSGESWHVRGPSGIFPTRGKPLMVPLVNSELDFLSLGIFAAEPAGTAPFKVLEQLWT